jgi:hypothetical protein
VITIDYPRHAGTDLDLDGDLEEARIEAAESCGTSVLEHLDLGAL